MLPVPDLDQWEAVEGMLLSLTQTLAVTSNANLGRDGSVDLSLDGRLFYPTEVAEPGETALAVASLNRRSRITLDDGSLIQNPLPLPPYLGQQNTLRAGDAAKNLTGILVEDGSGYRFHPTRTVKFTRVSEREPAPARANGALRVVVLHSDDYFNGDGQGTGFPGTRGAETAVEFARQRSKIINAIVDLNADILGILALENDGYETDSAIQDLVNGLNQTAPSGTTYAFISPGIEKLGGSEIAVGFVYRREAVSPVGTAVTIDSSPFNKLNGRPLAHAFAATGNGERFVATITHWQERGDCPQQGDPNADQNDGQGCWNILRKQAAQTLAAWMESDPTGSADADILIMGDLSAYSREDPLKILDQAGYINLAGSSPRSSYTSNAGGESGAQIHAFATPSLAAQTDGATPWHINADEPLVLDYRMTNQPALYTPDAYRSASDDPLVIDLILTPIQTTAEQIFLPLIRTRQ
jgi:predicted extracellular nuclease